MDVFLMLFQKFNIASVIRHKVIVSNWVLVFTFYSNRGRSSVLIREKIYSAFHISQKGIRGARLLYNWR